MKIYDLKTDANLLWIRKYALPRVLSLILIQALLRFIRSIIFYMIRKDSKIVDNYIQPITHLKSETVIVFQMAIAETSYDKILEQFSSKQCRLKWDSSARLASMNYREGGHFEHRQRKRNTSAEFPIHSRCEYFINGGSLFVLESLRTPPARNSFRTETLWLFEGPNKLTVF